MALGAFGAVGAETSAFWVRNETRFRELWGSQEQQGRAPRRGSGAGAAAALGCTVCPVLSVSCFSSTPNEPPGAYSLTAAHQKLSLKSIEVTHTPRHKSAVLGSCEGAVIYAACRRLDHSQRPPLGIIHK